MKKFLGFLLMAAVVFGLSACNQSETESFEELYRQAVAERDRLQAEVDELRAEVERLMRTVADMASNGDNADAQTEIGDIIQFGGLDWLVIAVDEGRALVLSDKVLELRPFDLQGFGVWETSSIREFLNGAFFDTTFNDSEKGLIIETTLTAADGSTTTDNIFLLSVEEVYEHMGDNALANIRDARIAENISTGYREWWWLRTSGRGGGAADRVYGTGCVDLYGGYADDGEGGVRPALWLSVR